MILVLTTCCPMKLLNKTGVCVCRDFFTNSLCVLRVSVLHSPIILGRCSFTPSFHKLPIKLCLSFSYSNIFSFFSALYLNEVTTLKSYMFATSRVLISIIIIEWKNSKKRKVMAKNIYHHYLFLSTDGAMRDIKKSTLSPKNL